MLLSKKRPLKDPATSLVINNYPIERVKEFKLLGYVIEEHFSWKAHIQYITSNISKMIGLLTKLRKTFDVETLHSLYFAFIHSYLINGITVWGSAAKVPVNPLVKHQKHLTGYKNNLLFLLPCSN